MLSNWFSAARKSAVNAGVEGLLLVLSGFRLFSS